MIELARGKALDALASNFGVTRRRLWWTLWVFKESDRSLRHRTQGVVLDTLTRSESVQALYRIAHYRTRQLTKYFNFGG